jgi:hypothetical protein
MRQDRSSFSTRTGFASLLGYSTSLMNPTSCNLLTSCHMTLCLSGVYLLSFFLIGLNNESILNLCSITSLGILGISDIFHVKTSRFSQRKVTSVSSYLGLSFELILSFLFASLRLARTSLLSSSIVVPFSCCLPFDRQATGWRLRQHRSPSALSMLTRYHWSVALASMSCGGGRCPMSWPP